MIISLFTYTRIGIRTARETALCFPEDNTGIFVPERICEPDLLPLPKPAYPLIEERFRNADVLIFICSCGIAVREIAPFIRSKQTDPAVLCMDESGKFIIPILSGHIGGANELAVILAEKLGGQAVITTASDCRGRFSADAWAARNGIRISSMQRAKEIAAAILETDIPLVSQLPIDGNYPPGTYPGGNGPAGIFIGWARTEPFEKTLRLIPPVLHLGIGCRKGSTAENIASAVELVLEQNDLDPMAVKCAASIDLKAGEEGLLTWCREQGIPATFYSASELKRVPGSFSGSDFVRETTGVDNVCERAAMCGADELIVKKTVLEGVTVAVAAEKRRLRFE